MTAKTFRSITRTVHLLLAVALGVTLYSPLSESSVAEAIGKRVVMPLLAITGCCSGKGTECLVDVGVTLVANETRLLKPKSGARKMDSASLLSPWKSDFARGWDKLRGSVGRPNCREVSIFEEAVGPLLTCPECNAVVLGATPELRSMLASYPVNVTLFDACEEMVHAMSEMTTAESISESAVIGNWLDSSCLPKSSAHVIFGDLVLSNLPFDMHKQFLNNVKEWLTPGGIFVSRIESFKPIHQNRSYEELFSRVSRIECSQKAIVTFWDGAWLVGPQKTRPIVVREFYQGSLDALDKGTYANVERTLEEGGIVFPLEKVWYSHVETELLDLLTSYFTVEETLYDPMVDAWFRDYLRIYVLRKEY